MAYGGMLIPTALLSILASVAAFSFLITQLIFMCFGRSKKKWRRKKTAGKIAGKNHGESRGVVLSDVVRVGAKETDAELGVKCHKVIGDRSRIDGVHIRVDGGGDNDDGGDNGAKSKTESEGKGGSGDGNSNDKFGDNSYANCDADKRIGDGDLKGETKIPDNDAFDKNNDDGVDRNDHKDIRKCETKNHYSDGGNKAYEGTDLDRTNINADSHNTGRVAKVKDTPSSPCINNISGSSSDVTSGTANVESKALNIDGSRRAAAYNGIETKPSINVNQIKCSFDPRNETRESSDADSDSSNETSQSTDGKSLPTSCNHQCACQCNQVDINDSDGQSSICEDHGVVYIQKRRIQLQLNVDITKYQINDESCNLSEQFSDEAMENNSLNRTSNTFTSFYENALCDKGSTREITSKRKNTACSIFQQNMIKDQSSIKFCPGGQIVRENMKIIKQSERNDSENVTENTTKFSANNDGLFPGNNCHENGPFSCKNIPSGEPETRGFATQLFAEYCKSESGSRSEQNSPIVSNSTHASTESSSIISCHCSSEYDHGTEMDSASSDEIMNSYEYNINTKKSTDLCPSSRSKIYAMEHCINMDCIDYIEKNFGYKSEKTCKNGGEKSSIFRRLLFRIGECCISALNTKN